MRTSGPAIHFALVLALSLGGELGCSREDRIAKRLARAEAYLAEHEVEEALLELQGALKLSPHDPELNERLGSIYRDRGDFQSALFHYGEAYRADPERVSAAMGLASLIWHDSPERAARIIHESKLLRPDDPVVLRTESGLALVEGDFARALSLALEAIEREPDAAENWFQLGVVHMVRIPTPQEGSGDPREGMQRSSESAYRDAIEAFDRVDELRDGSIAARIEKARIHAAWPGHWQEAVREYRSAIELAKRQDDPNGRITAALALEEYSRRSKRGELKLEAWREVVEARPERVASWEMLARATRVAAGDAAAKRIFEEMLERNSESAAAHTAYSRYLTRHHRYDEAMGALERAIAAGIDDPEIFEQLIQTQLARPDVEGAEASYAEMQKLYPTASASRRSAARVAIAAGRPGEALELLRTESGEREDSESERLRALALLRLGRLEDAKAKIARALALSPEQPVAALRLKLIIHSEAGEWQSVQRSAAEIQQYGHRLTSGERVIVARSLYEMGRPAEGRETLEQLLAQPAIQPKAALEYAKWEGRSDPEVAREHLERSLRAAPGNVETLEALTRIDLRAGRQEQALLRLEKLGESSLTGPRVLLLRAESLMSAGHLDRAEADALRAFEAAPGLPGAIELLLAIHRARGELDEARRSLEQADAAGLLHVGARVLLARIYLAQGDTARARQLFEQALEESPSFAPAKLGTASALAAVGEDLDRAMRLAEQGRRALPNEPHAADAVGYVYLRGGRHEAALEQFRHAIELLDTRGAAGVAEFHYHLGLALIALDRGDEASEGFREALLLDPDFRHAADARRQLESSRSGTASSS